MGGQENVPAGHLEPTGTAWNMERTVQGKSMTSLESFQGLEWLGRPLLPCLLKFVMLLGGTGALIPPLLMGRRMGDCPGLSETRAEELDGRSQVGISWKPNHAG